MQAGIPHNPDFNGPRQEGIGFYQFTINNAPALEFGPRLSRPGEITRKNLTIATANRTPRRSC